MGWPTQQDIIEHIEDDSMEGWCTNCLEWTHDSCEPDARNYTCPVCEHDTVFAAEEMLLCCVDDTEDYEDDCDGDY
jgi:Zn finger protein HypA/HybF involved in hydrogenase expression